MKLLITLLITLCVFCVQAETYVLIHINGSIKSGNLVLQEGDSVKSSDPISFSSLSNSVILLSGKTLYSIKPSATLEAQQLDQLPLTALVHTTPTTRETESIVSDLANYFGNSTFTFTRERFKLMLAQKDTFSTQQFYIFRYQYNGKIVSKKISENASILTFEKKYLYTTKKGKEIPCDSTSHSEILRYNVEERSFTKVVAFEALWKRDEIKDELTILKKAYAAMKIPEIESENEMIKFVKSVYGKTDEYLLKLVIKNIN